MLQHDRFMRFLYFKYSFLSPWKKKKTVILNHRSIWPLGHCGHTNVASAQSMATDQETALLRSNFNVVHRCWSGPFVWASAEMNRSPILVNSVKFYSASRRTILAGKIDKVGFWEREEKRGNSRTKTNWSRVQSLFEFFYFYLTLLFLFVLLGRCLQFGANSCDIFSSRNLNQSTMCSASISEIRIGE